MRKEPMKTPDDIRTLKGNTPIVSLTAYSTPMAKLLDDHCDLVLVGDSLGMTVHGLDDTLGVSLEMMIMHGKAVARGLNSALMVVDMPFGSYERNPEQAFGNAAKLMIEADAGAVKLEGGEEMAETIRFLVKRGIPVMGHIGLTPQSVNTLGGYKVQGRDAQADQVIADAHAVSDAGAFAVVLEKIPQNLADRITKDIQIPTIGIGASNGCDGQILVLDDMLGIFSEFKPKFVKRFAELGQTASEAVGQYANEVRARAFPTKEHMFADQVSGSRKSIVDVQN
ncbi:3-methyl-2-oxobutanoate hydroxymethyltransferase [Litoreibacter sp.]|nr:3-methyl-2-oxobutanoate hydroxymethyltransferase [Litoreibacter sp.]